MRNQWQKYVVPCLYSLLLAGCGSVLKVPASADPVPSRPMPAAPGAKEAVPALPAAGSGRGGYYQDDGPGDQPPEGLQAMPDAEPKVEPYSARGNKPYVVFGKSYTPITDDRPFKQRGVGSWYGKKFHGQKTSSGELYDMYKMTAAHPTLPLPSYARVTNLSNGTQVIVRINDRGPFHSSRIIDLSYTAALKLGYLSKGSSMLEVERLLPDEIARITAAKQNSQVQPPEPVAVPAPAFTPEANTNAPSPYAAAGSASPPIAKPLEAAFVADTASANANGFYLQLGAYTQATNAEAARSGLAQKWASTLPAIEVVEYGVFYRLYSGPFATRNDADNAAQQVQDAGLSKPLVVQR